MAQIIIELDDTALAAVCSAFGKHLGSTDTMPAVVEVTAEQAGALPGVGDGAHLIVDIAPTSTPRDATLDEVKQWVVDLISKVVQAEHEREALDAAKATAATNAKAMASSLNIS